MGTSALLFKGTWNLELSRQHAISGYPNQLACNTLSMTPLTSVIMPFVWSVSMLQAQAEPF